MKRQAPLRRVAIEWHEINYLPLNNKRFMKFNIISAQIKKIKADAKQNAGEEYVEAVVKM